MLLISDATETEIAEVLVRPEIQEEYHLTTAEIEETLRLLHTDAQKCTPAAVLPVSLRDPKDEKILALAIGGQADYLVTGDKDLLVLKKYAGGEILTVAAFLQILKTEGKKAA